ncbi:MAG TPA: bifunctional histidinol-phosphatase/imidazoleglycerol-phosphate dehydratase HisB [Rhodanobacteraceae bacterium]|nr:bifunctional histidinol-phosphatase/imidazoleglycerol-phosphate dehydratase HisB [Rhodanobacteraceae bacterium]
MSGRKILFIDRDGCILTEPADEQVDRLDKLGFLPDVVLALRRIVDAGFELVMVSNQDGLGTASFPQADFDPPQQMMLAILASQGIRFHEVLVDRSFPADGLDTRKPGVGLVRHYLADDSWSRADSAMVGDRETDLQFAANLGVTGYRVGAAGQGWLAIAHQLLDRPRQAEVRRNTNETRITARVDLDTVAAPRISTGIVFFDHMLEQLGKHGGFTLVLECAGDLDVDDHHSVEDSALAIGAAIRQALGDKRGIQRYGFCLPMDEAQARVTLDLSGRPCLVFDGHFPVARVGALATEMVPHFFRSLCDTLGANLHIEVRGDNAHHMVEACFKAVARCLRQAIRRDGDELPSTKGAL